MIGISKTSFSYREFYDIPAGGRVAKRLERDLRSRS